MSDGFVLHFGGFALVAATVVAVYGAIGGFFGAWKEREGLARSAYNAAIAATCLSVTTLIALAVLFLRHDYRFAYVWQNSNNDMPPWYLVSAIWGGMDGSMLLWGVMLSAYSGLALASCTSKKLRPWLTSILCVSTASFLLIVTLSTNPFRLVPTLIMPTNGNGLNPLLQNPSMLIHPICLYLGFTGFVIPFAYCMAALLSGDLSGQWIQLARRWTLVAWGFLTVGIILGGHWAYIELGWGGFWAWDPVENASFLPWLTATAFLHSVIVQERRNMLRIWNVSLCALTYILTVFGTFLTRSGIVQSVHAFAEGNVGQWLLTYIVFITLLTIVTIAYRYRELRSPESLESYFSREAAFLFNNLVLLGICFATFWGVMFPVFSEALGYEKSVVGPPFFNQVNGPLFLVLIALMGYGPLISWKRNSWQNFAKLVWRPLLAGSAVTVLFLGIDGTRIIAAVSFGLFVFVLGTIMGEFHRAARIRRELSQGEGALQSLVSVVRRKPERYGGYIVHLGVVFMAVGITASTIYKIEKDFVLKLGQPAELGGYSLELMSLQEEQFKNYAALRAVVQVRDAASRQILGELHPEQRFYPASQQTTTEVDTRATPWQDLYIALGGIDPELKETGAAFKVFINPLQFWVWVGGMIMLGGTLVLVVSAFRMRQVVRESVVTSSVVRA